MKIEENVKRLLNGEVTEAMEDLSHLLSQSNDKVFVENSKAYLVPALQLVQSKGAPKDGHRAESFQGGTCTDD